MKKLDNIILYQTKSGALEIRGDFKNDTIWATQSDISQLFEINRTSITKHINNILKNKEILEKSNVQKLHIANSDKPVTFYSLDMILAVGFRTNSKKAIEFRRWASQILKQNLINGYSFNKKILIQNSEKFNDALEKIRSLIPKHSDNEIDAVLDLINTFAKTWFSLDAFDKEEFPNKGLTLKKVKLDTKELRDALDQLKNKLIEDKQTTEIFSKELKKDGLESIIGNIFQSFSGLDVYPSLEEKAANLLYLIIKNHPFVDGNKRCGAFSFIWFLRKFKILPTNFQSEVLTSIALLVAISDPKEKEKMIGLILLLLNQR